MIPVTLNELKIWLNPIHIYQKRNSKFTSISINTRTLKRGDLFIAIKGARFDGHYFAEEACKKGASALIISKKSVAEQLIKVFHETTIIVVPDTLLALQELTRNVRKKWNKTLIAITGSCGKTTTKDIVFQFLNPYINTICSQGTYTWSSEDHIQEMSRI